jgi:hypothetical protein
VFKEKNRGILKYGNTSKYQPESIVTPAHVLHAGGFDDI